MSDFCYCFEKILHMPFLTRYCCCVDANGIADSLMLFFDSTDFPVLSVKPLLWDLVLLFLIVELVELVGRSTVFSSQDF